MVWAGSNLNDIFVPDLSPLFTAYCTTRPISLVQQHLDPGAIIRFLAGNPYVPPWSPFLSVPQDRRNLTNSGLLGLLGSKLTPTAHSSRNATLEKVNLASSHQPAANGAYQIQRSPDQLVSHAGTILRSPSSHQDDTVLLNVVTLARDKSRYDLSARQSHTGCLSFARIGLLGPGDADLDADALHLRRALFGESGRHGMAGSLGFPTALKKIHR